MNRDTLAMAGCLTAAQAEQVVAPMATAWTLRAKRKLYYPYFWFGFRSYARTVFGTSSAWWSSLVDARTGLGYTADRFDLERIDTDEPGRLDTRLAEEEALAVAQRYVGYVGRHRRRALVFPALKLLSQRLIYKPFWIVEGTRPDQPSFRMLVDGITGQFHPIGR